MRVLLPVILIFGLFSADTFAQPEATIQAFEAGVAAAQDGNYEKALANFEKALEKSKFSTDLPATFLGKINYNLGVCYYRTGRPELAVAYLEAALALTKNKYPKAFHALGMALTELKNWRAAKTAIQSAIESNRKDSESWFDLAMIYLAEKDLANATVAFQKAVQFKSADSATAHNNLGVIAALKGDWTAAEKEFETALELSRGRLAEAMRNLEFCRASIIDHHFVAKLEFIRQFNEKTIGEENGQ